MGKRKMIILGFLLFLIWSCNNIKEKKKDQDSFYTNTGGWDWIRIPLIRPYEIKKADPKIKTNTWSIEFVNSFGTFNVKQVDVKDSIIFILSGRLNREDDSTITLVNSENVPTGWYVINTKNQTEKSFNNKIDFKQYIRKKGYPEPHWLGVDSLSHVLSKGGKLPWFPK